MFDDTRLDDAAALASADGFLRGVASWGAEVRKAHQAALPVMAGLRPGDRPRAVVAAGANGRLFRAVLEPICPVPFVAWPRAGLPGWAGPLDLVVLVSHSGDDATGAAVAAEARRRGCELLVACPTGSPVAGLAAARSTTILPAGSRDPLALSVPVLAALHLLGLGPEVAAEPVAAALDGVALRCAPSRPMGQNPAKDLALVLADAVPVVWGGSVLAARAARRVAEALRPASGRPAVAGEAAQLVPLLENARERDVFADPFAAPLGQPVGTAMGPVDDLAGDAPAARPALLVLDDGSDDAAVSADRDRLLAAADSRRVATHVVDAVDVSAAKAPLSPIGTFAALQAAGRFTAAYLAVGLSRSPG